MERFAWWIKPSLKFSVSGSPELLHKNLANECRHSAGNWYREGTPNEATKSWPSCMIWSKLQKSSTHGRSHYISEWRQNRDGSAHERSVVYFGVKAKLWWRSWTRIKERTPLQNWVREDSVSGSSSLYFFVSGWKPTTCQSLEFKSCVSSSAMAVVLLWLTCNCASSKNRSLQMLCHFRRGKPRSCDEFLTRWYKSSDSFGLILRKLRFSDANLDQNPMLKELCLPLE